MNDAEPYGSITPEITATAGSVRRWVRINAVAFGTCGALLLVAELLGVFALATRFVAGRAVLLGIGTSYTLMALALLVQAFLLFRYTDQLDLVVRQRRAAPLVDAARYEQAYWWLVAAIIFALVAGSLLVLAGPGMQAIVGAMETPKANARPAPQPLGDDDNTMACGLLALAGIVLVGFALRP